MYQRMLQELPHGNRILERQVFPVASKPTLQHADLGTKTCLQEQRLGSRIHVHGSICDWTQITEFTAELRGCENPDAETHNDDHEKHPVSTAFRYGGKALMARCVCPPGAPPVTEPERS